MISLGYTEQVKRTAKKMSFVVLVEFQKSKIVIQIGLLRGLDLCTINFGDPKFWNLVNEVQGLYEKTFTSR